MRTGTGRLGSAAAFTGSGALGGSGGNRPQILQLALHVGIVDERDRFAEQIGRLQIVLPVPHGLRRLIFLVRNLRQHAAPNVGERVANARRGIPVAGLEERIGADDSGYGRVGFVASSERQQTERAVLFDRPAVERRRHVRFAEAIEGGQRFVVASGCVQLARRRQRILTLAGRCAGGGDQDAGEHEGLDGHCLFMSTLTRIGPPSVTDTA
jgi:hypothetical protein